MTITDQVDESAGVREWGAFRYGAVFVVMLVLLVFAIVAPSGDATYATILALEATALLIVVATSRERRSVRNARARLLGFVAVICVTAVATGIVHEAVVSAANGVLTLSILVALVGGLLRLVRLHGVTVQVVAGALTIYVLTGLIFAWLVGLAANIGAEGFFAQGGDGTIGQRVYYRFTVLTTTGFGDLTAASQPGRALAVVEMLVGQLYLVTVIGVIVGNLARRAGD